MRERCPTAEQRSDAVTTRPGPFIFFCSLPVILDSSELSVPCSLAYDLLIAPVRRRPRGP